MAEAILGQKKMLGKVVTASSCKPLVVPAMDKLAQSHLKCSPKQIHTLLRISEVQVPKNNIILFRIILLTGWIKELNKQNAILVIRSYVEKPHPLYAA